MAGMITINKEDKRAFILTPAINGWAMNIFLLT
jgi:hypothetical protein